MEFYLTMDAWSVTRPERLWLVRLASDMEDRKPNPVIVSIGVLFGATTHCLRAGAPTAHLFGVDIDYTTHPVQREAELRATLITGDSHECHKDFDLGIDLLFLDGDHHYDAVKADIIGWAPKVQVGGIFAFHDYSPSGANLASGPWIAGVRQAVDEWQAEAKWKLVGRADSVIAFEREE